MMPQRIQLRRTKGWRKPDGTVTVSRPTKWGNPFIVSHWEHREKDYPKGHWCCIVRNSFAVVSRHDSKLAAQEKCVEMFRKMLMAGAGHSQKWLDFLWKWSISEESTTKSLEFLRGKDLACWCKIGEPCHADILIELANQ